MPAIAVGAALAAIWSVKAAGDAARKSVDDMYTAATNANASYDAAGKRMMDLLHNGTPAQKEAAKKWFAGNTTPGHSLGYAGGTENADEGYRWVGEHGPELMYMQGGEKVRPASQSQSMAKSNSHVYHIQNVILQGAASTKQFFESVDQDTLLASRGLTPNRGMR
jgi:hypothetical protein